MRIIAALIFFAGIVTASLEIQGVFNKTTALYISAFLLWISIGCLIYCIIQTNKK
jgi:xanthine/uracil permease